MSPGRIRPGAASSGSDGSNNDGAADDELVDDGLGAADPLDDDLEAGDFEAVDEPDDELDDEPEAVLDEPPATFTPPGAVDLDESSEEVIDEVLAEQALEVAPLRDHGVFRRLYYGETTFDFVRRKRIWFTISSVVILLGVLSLAIRGLDYSIEFVGGTSWTVPSSTLTISQTQTALTAAGLTGETIVSLGSGTSRSIEVQAKLPKGQTAAAHQDQAVKIATVLQKLAHKSSINDVSVESVGPSWGGQITQKAVIALIVFFILVSLYISIFFEWRMALAAIIAVVHDIMVTVGIYSLSGFLVTPDTVVAFLTILGYSLYDTIVVFDRVRDNVKNLSVRDRLTFSDIVNLSMNQTLARSLNTSLVAIMPILSVLVIGAQLLGAQTLQYFGLALLVGLTTGAYSSIFIASPLVAVMKEREPKYRQLRQRIELRGPSAWLLSPAEVAHGFAPDSPNRTRSTIVAPMGQGGGRVRPGSAAKAAAARPAPAKVTSPSGSASRDQVNAGRETPTCASPTRRPTLIDVRAARSDPDRFRAALARKGGAANFDAFLEADAAWRHLDATVGALRARSRPKGKPTPDELVVLAGVKEELRSAESALDEVASRRDALLAAIPNPPDDSTPDGDSDEDAEEVSRFGEPPKFGFTPKNHMDLGGFDTERATRLSGTRFAYRMGATALVELSLYRYALDHLVALGFTPVLPPVIVREEALYGTGFLPTDETNLYRVEPDGLYLSGTSEVALAGLHQGEILDAEEMPLRYAGYSTNFRREAGAAGRDTKGIMRLHQFDKVEMFFYTFPEQSAENHEEILAIEEAIVQGLGLAYRVINTAAGDLGPSAAKKYDIEAWIPSEERYREITSCSNTTDYQARRLGIRYRDGRDTRTPHTLNGTAMTARFLIAILESFQDEGGHVVVPDVLRAFGAPAAIEPAGRAH